METSYFNPFNYLIYLMLARHVRPGNEQLGEQFSEDVHGWFRKRGVLCVRGTYYAFLTTNSAEEALTRSSGRGLPFSVMCHALVATSLEKGT